MQYFGPKIRFLIWDPDFRKWPVCSPRRYLWFGTFGSIFKLFVSELRTTGGVRAAADVHFWRKNFGIFLSSPEVCRIFSEVKLLVSTVNSDRTPEFAGNSGKSTENHQELHFSGNNQKEKIIFWCFLLIWCNFLWWYHQNNMSSYNWSLLIEWITYFDPKKIIIYETPYFFVFCLMFDFENQFSEEFWTHDDFFW